MSLRIVSLWGFVVILMIAVGCGVRSRQKDSGVISVSILPLKYLVDEISGGDFEVSVIVPPGVSPETYEPTTAQMRLVTRSQAYFQIGLIDFEKNLSDGINDNVSDLPMVRLSGNMSLLEGECGHFHSAGQMHVHGTDPHVWLSPSRIKIMVNEMAGQLGELLPDSAAKYDRNRIDLISRVDSVDRYIQQSITGMEGWSVLVFHPFLTYYCDDYDVKQIAVEQEGKEPSVNHMKHLVAEIEQRGIKFILYQQQLHEHAVQALVQETGIIPVKVDPLAYNILDNLKKITDHIAHSPGLRYE